MLVLKNPWYDPLHRIARATNRAGRSLAHRPTHDVPTDADVRRGATDDADAAALPAGAKGRAGPWCSHSKQAFLTS